jgi:hypothetical protein
MAKYKLNCYGWSLEAIGKILTDEQVKKIEDLMKRAGYEELWEVRHDLDELLDIDIWDGDLFHVSKAFDNGTMYFTVEDDMEKEVLAFDIDETGELDEDYYDKNEYVNYDTFPKDKKLQPRNTYLSVDENKGGLYYMEFESDEVPSSKDFTFTTGCIETPNGDWDFIDKIFYKGEELEIVDWLDNSGKSSTLEIFTHDDRILK